MNDGASDASSSGELSANQVLLLAVAIAVVTANAYYIHPIIARVGEAFSVSDAMIGIVPALNQIALAVGIFFLLPLGDRFSNRRLAIIFVACQFVTIVGMALAQSFWVFTAASTLLGFFTIAPYLLPAYASKRVEPGRLGRVTAVLTAGIILGILVARTGAGVVGEHFGWRAVYIIAAVMMLAITATLPFIMRAERLTPREGPRGSYAALVWSIFPLVRAYPEILLSGLIQALNFGVFLLVWMGIGLHLTSPEMGYGVDTVGYLAGVSVFSILATPRLGSWADKVGGRRARFLLSIGNLGGACLLAVSGQSVWVLCVPIIIMNLVGPGMDVAGRMTFLDRPPEIRTRLMTVFIMMMFTGGGAASWAGTAAYAYFGWIGTAGLAIAMSSSVVLLSAFALRFGPRGSGVSR